MKNIKIISLLFILFLLITSCIKDNSNDNFIEPNNMKISELEDVYTAELGMQFKLTPTVELADNDVSYIWYIYSDMAASKRDTLSTQKDLDVILTGDKTIPGIDYTLVFRVTDNKTGIYSAHKQILKVQAIYTSGLLLLCDKGNQRELHMLKSENVLLKNIFELNNEIKLDNNIHQVAFANPNKVNTALKHVLLLGKSQDGGYVLDPISMAIKYSVRNMFDGTIHSDIIDVRNYSGLAGNIEYIIVNGKLHKRVSNMGTILFQAASMVPFGGPGTYSTLGVFSATHQPLLFDNLNGRMLAHYSWNKGSLIPANPNVSSMTHFDVNNMGNIEEVISGKIGAKSYWLIGRDRNTGVSSIFKFNYELTEEDDDQKYVTLDKVTINNAIAPNFEGATSFVSNTSIFGTCFYVKNNKLYALNIESTSSSSSTLAEVMIKDFGLERITVTGIEFPTVDIPDETNPLKTVKSHQLRLFVQDESLTSLKGGFIFYEVTTSGGININKEMNRYIGGFCDTIIDIDEKVN